MSSTGHIFLGVPGVRIYQPASPNAAITEVSIEQVNGGMVPLYDSTNGVMSPRYLNQTRSLTISGRTANAIHDVYAVPSGSTGVEIAITTTPWATNTAGPGVTLVQGYRVNAAAFTDLRTGGTIAQYAGLYLGAVRFTAAGTTAFTAAKAFIWNQYNRRPWPLKIAEATSHSYSSTTVREWNGGAGTPPRIEWVSGEAGYDLRLAVTAQVQPQGIVGIGHDGTAGISYDPYIYSGGSPYTGYNPSVPVTINVGVGYHWTTIVQYSASGATQFYVGWQTGEIQC